MVVRVRMSRPAEMVRPPMTAAARVVAGFIILGGDALCCCLPVVVCGLGDVGVNVCYHAGEKGLLYPFECDVWLALRCPLPRQAVKDVRGGRKSVLR